ncbi:MAG: MFS transporter [Dehalococcoidia bacterium]|nr:MFS transporter [Dehalococcoidia bacterium]
MNILGPQSTLSSSERTQGLRMMTLEGMASLGFTSIITSGFLAAYALALGANNLQIGILAALPFIMQPLQIPALLLVEKLRRRKAITAINWLVAQLLWFPVALIPIFSEVPGAGAVSLLLILMGIRGVFGSITNCSYNSWIRDLVPQEILGRFFSSRLALSTAVASAFGLGAAFFVDYWSGQATEGGAIIGYTYVLLFGAFFLGLASPFFMTRMPEPLMQEPSGEQISLWKTVISPLRDRNFRQLMRFLLSWSFALNMAVPFFAVYMLQRIGLSLSAVVALYVLSQLFNILFLRVWGPLADRFGSKSVLSLCVSLYLLVILGWTFTTMPEQYFLTIPLLIILHIFAGIATAGVSLTVSTIGFKLAPKAQAAPYLVGASMATNFGAGIGPIAGGLLAFFFNERKLALDLTWVDPERTFNLGVFNLSGFDFLFMLTFIIGLITLNMLAALREEGEADRDVVLGELRAQSSPIFQSVSPVLGSNFLNLFPLSLLSRVPGVDVAIGVTAYQLSDAAKKITSAALQGGRTAVKVVRALTSGFAGLWKIGAETPEYDIEFARQAAKGAFRAINETPGESGHMVGQAIVGIVRALDRAHISPYDALHGAAYGIIEGAGETGSDLTRVTGEIISAAGETARTLKLKKEDAVQQAACGASEAAEMLGPQAAVRVRESLPQDLIADLKISRKEV